MSLAGLPTKEAFRRGSGPLVSVLLPTRGRSNFLLGALESLYATASKPSDIETIIKIDDDDTATRDVATKLVNLMGGCPISVCSGPRGKGYLEMHQWINQLCGMAKGDWLIFWNDDTRMLTLGWDTALLNCGGGFADGLFMFICKVLQRPSSNEFLFIRREMYEVLGHLSMSCHVDTYVATIMIMIQRAMHSPIEVSHAVNQFKDVTGDEKRASTEWALNELFTTKMIRQKMADATKLIEHMEKFGSKT
jgi:hypothetical protein